MNWILTIFFYLVIFNCYYILGDTTLTLLKYEDRKPYKSFLFGFIMFFFIGFIIGVIGQVFQTSWSAYAILMSLAYLVVYISILYLRRNWIEKLIKNIKSNWKEMLLEHLKSFWFIYVLVFLFSVLSMTNILPYLQQNYDDTYYISKVVNSVQMNKLNTEDWFNGNLMLDRGIDIERVLNTYELTYGYFGTIFGIDLPFFCRGTMVIHNYILMFFTYVSLAREFIKKEYAQFTILPFSIYLISHGYLMEGGLPFIKSVRTYDGWQLQTAMFYGGSVCRTMCMPLLYIFMKPLFKKITFKSLLIIFIISCTMVSFSTIAVQQVLLVALVAVIVKLLIQVKDGSNLMRFLSIVALVGIIVVYFKTKNIDMNLYSNIDEFYSDRQDAYAFYQYYALYDVIMKCALPVILLAIVFFRKKEFTYISLTTLMLWYIFYSNHFVELLNITSFKFFFVSLRSMASVQYLIMFIGGCLFIKILTQFKIPLLCYGLLSILCLTTIGLYSYKHYDEIKDMDFLGSGMTIYGYSFDNLSSNDQLMPQLFVDVGEYFDQLPYGNYRLWSETALTYNKSIMFSTGFAFSSNRIETCYAGGCDGMTEEKNMVLTTFNNTSENFDEVDTIVHEKNINYLLATNEDSMKKLIEKGYNLVLTSKSEKDEFFYLMETNINK